MTKEEVVDKAIEIEFGLGNTRSIREHNSSLVKIAEHVYDLLQPSLPSNLDEAVGEYLKRPEVHSSSQWEDLIIYHAFRAAAEWREKQMLSETVEGEIKDFRFIREINYSSAKIEFNSIPKLKNGNKVRILILKENSHE